MRDLSRRAHRDTVGIAIVPLLLFAATGRATAEVPPRFGIGLESGALWFARNDARIPGDTGTEFDATAFTGSGARAYARISGDWYIDDRHSVHLVYAPSRVTEVGRLAQDTDFEGESFEAGAAEGTYQFNAYKLTYRHTFADRGKWRWGVGFTAVVRDAAIGLRQDTTSASNDNVGFVPALHASGNYRLDDRWTLRLEFDGLAGGPGRLFDVAVKLDHDLNAHWQLGVGYRTLEGGADTDDVYNFAWLNYAMSELRYRF